MKVSVKQLAQTLFDLTDGKSRSEIQNSIADFARYIYKERKLALADKIIAQFGKLYNEKNGIVETKVISAKKLESSQVHKVESYIEKKYQAKKVVLKNIVDESVKGGLVLKVGDEVVDGSVRKKLTDLRKFLTN